MILLRCRHLSASPPLGPIDPATLLRVCTVLFQQQRASDSRLHSRLRALDFHLSHELFLQICNRFPFSSRPIIRLFRYADNQSFPLSPIAVNKMINIFGESQSTNLLWDFLNEIVHRKGMLNSRSMQLAIRAFARGNQLKKCVGVFHLFSRLDPVFCSVSALNGVVAELCSLRLVHEAKEIVFKLKDLIKPDGATYSLLVIGFCRAGNLVAAAKIWNIMADDRLAPEVGSYNEMIATFFKSNRSGEAMAIFESMRGQKLNDLEMSTYRTVILWLCKGGKIERPMMLMAEMLKRGIDIDGSILGSLGYGLICRRRINEAYKIMAATEEAPGISVYHGLIKGLLRIRRVREATEVFREMTRRGIQPCMHTYVMLLQGHLGKRGRKTGDRAVSFETIFVGGMVKSGRMLDVTKYIERAIRSGTEVPRFDYNKFLRDFSNEEGVVMFEQVGRRLNEIGMMDLGDIFLSYGEKMATRERRRVAYFNR